MTRTFALAAVVAAGLAAPALAQDAKPGIDPRAAILAGPCFSCHGADGTGAGTIPALKGRPAIALLDQLKAFKSGAAPSTVMGRLAKGYSDEQLELLANYWGVK